MPEQKQKEELKDLSDYNIRYLMGRFFRDYLKPNWKKYLPIQMAHIVTALVGLIPPLILRRLIDNVIPAKNVSGLINLSLIALGVFIAIAIGQMLRSYFGHQVAQKIVYDMRNDLYGHFQELPMKFHDNRKTGELMSRVIDDLNRLQEFTHHGPEGLLTAVTRIVGVLAIMFTLDVSLTFVALSFTPILIIYGYFLIRRMHQAFRKNRGKKAELSDRLEDNLAGVKVIKAFANEEFEMERFSEKNRDHYDARMGAIKYISILGPGAFLLNSVGLVSALGYGGYLVAQGSMTAGTIVAFYTYLLGFRGPILRLVHINEGLSRFLAAVERFFSHIDIEPDISSKQDAFGIDEIKVKTGKELQSELDTEKEPQFEENYQPERATRSSSSNGDESEGEKRSKKERKAEAKPEGHVTLEGVHFSYDESEQVLHDINIDVPPQRSVALVGPSGSGKTTVVRLIPRLYEVDRGTVKIDGVDVRDWDLNDLRNSIAMVMQDDYLFSGTIKENIRYGDPHASEERVIEMAKEANVHQFTTRMPDGYETDVGQRGVKLSGGQRQRISIARALLKDPSILVLDEATSSVDSYTEKLIQEAIDRVSQGRTTFTIAHRLSTIVDSDEILFIEDGRIKERGSFQELMDMEEKFYEFYKLQFESEDVLSS